MREQFEYHLLVIFCAFGRMPCPCALARVLEWLFLRDCAPDMCDVRALEPRAAPLRVGSPGMR